MTLRTETMPTVKAACDAARAALHAALRATSPEDVLVLLSGGSAVALLDAVPDGVAWARVTLGVVDERFGAADADRNDGTLRATPFVRHALANGARFLAVDHGVTDEYTAARDYEARLRAWRAVHPTSHVIAVLGVGSDGHTAGVMPFPEDPPYFARLFLDSDTWVVGYDAAGKNPFARRVTVTLAYLRDHVDAAIVYACGEAKCAALCDLCAVPSITQSLAARPARIFCTMRNVRLFTDCEV